MYHCGDGSGPLDRLMEALAARVEDGPFDSGWAAHDRGSSLLSNPYMPHSRSARAWEDGWLAAYDSLGYWR